MNIYQRIWRIFFPAKPDYVKLQLDSMQERFVSMREHYDTKVQNLERRIRELQPKPIKIVQCPQCNAQRRTERMSRTNAEAQQDGWWWSYVLFGLLCLTCGTEFAWETERKKVESVKGRRERLVREAAEREERKRQERRRREEQEAERRRRQIERRRMSSSDRSSSRSSFGSFGGGRSGGGGSSGRIR